MKPSSSLSNTKRSPAEDAPLTDEQIGWLKLVRRLVVFFVGVSILMLGMVMIVTPGPAFIVIPIGLAILATEFVWARTILEALKKRLPRKKSRSGSASAI